VCPLSQFDVVGFPHQNKLLILRGPPGVGKSTMVEVLAEELGLDVLGWSEAAGGQAWRGGASESAEDSLEGDAFGMGASFASRGEFAVPYVSQTEDFGTFLRGAAYQPLAVVTNPNHKVRAVDQYIRRGAGLHECNLIVAVRICSTSHTGHHRHPPRLKGEGEST